MLTCLSCRDHFCLSPFAPQGGSQLQDGTQHHWGPHRELAESLSSHCCPQTVGAQSPAVPFSDGEVEAGGAVICAESHWSPRAQPHPPGQHLLWKGPETSQPLRGVARPPDTLNGRGPVLLHRKPSCPWAPPGPPPPSRAHFPASRVPGQLCLPAQRNMDKTVSGVEKGAPQSFLVPLRQHPNLPALEEGPGPCRCR